MPERKHTPDVLGDILSADAPPPELEIGLPAAKPRQNTGGVKKAARPKAAPVAKTIQDHPVQTEAAAEAAQWEYLCVSFQEHRGWKARFINGKEAPDWVIGPALHDFLDLMGRDGWELCAASAGKPLYSVSDDRQMFFKRQKSARR